MLDCALHSLHASWKRFHPCGRGRVSMSKNYQKLKSDPECWKLEKRRWDPKNIVLRDKVFIDKKAKILPPFEEAGIYIYIITYIYIHIHMFLYIHIYIHIRTHVLNACIYVQPCRSILWWYSQVPFRNVFTVNVLSFLLGAGSNKTAEHSEWPPARSDRDKGLDIAWVRNDIPGQRRIQKLWWYTHIQPVCWFISRLVFKKRVSRISCRIAVYC